MSFKDSRFFKRTLSPMIGYFCSLCYVKSALISIILLIITLNINNQSLVESGFGSALISYIVNIVFYLVVANYFRKGKIEFGYAYIAMIILTISTYIIPFVFDAIGWVYQGLDGVGSSIWILSLISIMLGAILGIVYFFLMMEETKTRKKSYILGMIVIGIFISAIAIYSMIVNIYELVVVYQATTFSVVGIITLCINIYSQIILFLFSFLYLLYAYDVYRIRNGYIS